MKLSGGMGALSKASRLTRTSKFLSLILRHKPEEIGIELDSNGWAKVSELISGINIDRDTLNEIVTTDSKGRYEFDTTGTKIRARQGHSIDVDVELQEMEPPEILYHGTSEKNLPYILKDGIKPMSRKYVHLSSDKNTAYQVGKRHGLPVVLAIKAKELNKSGISFYISRNGVWLVGGVPVEFITKA